MRGFPDRAVLDLGYHSSGKGARQAYGCDLLEHPLRLLRALYAEIRSGAFLPDQGRGARLLQDDPVEELRQAAG
eukprot:6616642-Lingulodinium_polyedra.AAC.1